jgi:hypothetical protein
MTRTIKLVCAVAVAGSLCVGCNWPDTKMEPVGGTAVQTQQQPAAPPTSATDDSTKKKTNG